MRIQAFCGVVITSLLLSACGGGSGGESKTEEGWPLLPALGKPAVLNLYNKTVSLGNLDAAMGSYPYVQPEIALADDSRAAVLWGETNFEPTGQFRRNDMAMRINNQWSTNESVDLADKGNINSDMFFYSHHSGSLVVHRDQSLYMLPISAQLPAKLRAISADTTTEHLGTPYDMVVRVLDDGSLFGLQPVTTYEDNVDLQYNFLRYSQDKKLEGPVAITTIKDAVSYLARRPTISNDGSVTTVSSWCYQDKKTYEHVIMAALTNPKGLSISEPFEVARTNMVQCPTLKSTSTYSTAAIAWINNANDALYMAYISFDGGTKINVQQVSDVHSVSDYVSGDSVSISEYTLNIAEDKSVIFVWRDRFQTKPDNVTTSRLVWRKYTPANTLTQAPEHWDALTPFPYSEYPLLKDVARHQLPFSVQAYNTDFEQGPNGEMAVLWIGNPSFNKVPEKAPHTLYPLLASKYLPDTGWTQPVLLANFIDTSRFSMSGAINGKGEGLAAFSVSTWCGDVDSSCNRSVQHMMAVDF